MQAGVPVADAVLKELHRRVAGAPDLAAEFMGYFMRRLNGARAVDIDPQLRRCFDTGDVIGSVLGDLWPQLGELEFRDERSFLALLLTRLRWKTAQHRRRLNSGKRREDRRCEADLQEVSNLDATAPQDREILAEERRAFAVALFRLSPEEREVVRHYLDGKSTYEYAAAKGILPGSARKRLERAIHRLRSVLRDSG